MRDRLALRNRRGDRIDPVPPLVSLALAFMLVFSFGPIYGLSYGLSLRSSIVVSAGVFGVAATVVYAQLVRSAPPVDAGERPVAPRIERLVYVMIAIVVVLVGLTVPLVYP